MGIDIKGLNKKFIINKCDETIALDNVGVSFESVGSYLLFGKSGSGKSTFLKILYGLLKPDSGEIYLNNKKINGLNEYNAIYVPQDYGLIENLTVIENLKLALNGLIDNEFENKVNDIFKKLEIDDLIDQLVKNLSGGERAKVAFSRILLSKADIILLDEPTASIDKFYSLEVYKFIQELSKEKLVIVVSHDERIKDYIDNIYLMSKGKIKEDKKKIIKSDKQINVLNRKINDKLSIKGLYKKNKSSFLYAFLLIFSISLIFSIINLIIVQNYQIAGTIYENTNTNFLYSDSDIDSEYLNKYTYYDYSINLSGFFDSTEYAHTNTATKLVIDDDLDDDVICVSDYTLEMMVHTGKLTDYIDHNNESTDRFKTLSEADGETFKYNDYTYTATYYDTDYENHVSEHSYDSDYLEYEDSIYMMNSSTFKNFYINNSTFLIDKNAYSAFSDSTMYFCNLSKYTDNYSEYTDYLGNTLSLPDLDDNEILLSQEYFDDTSESNLASYIGQSIQINFSYNGINISKTFKIYDIYSEIKGDYSYLLRNKTVGILSNSTYNSLFSECLGDEETFMDDLNLDPSYVYTPNTNNYVSLAKYIYLNDYTLECYYSDTISTITNEINNMQSLAYNLIKIFLSINIASMFLFPYFDYKSTKKNNSKLLSYGYLNKDIKRMHFKLSIIMVLLSIPILAIVSALLSLIMNLSISSIVDQEGVYIKYLGVYSILFYIINLILFLFFYNFSTKYKVRYKG